MEKATGTDVETMAKVYQNGHIEYRASFEEIKAAYNDIKDHGWASLEDLKQRYGLK